MDFHEILYTDFTEKSTSQKNFGQPKMTLGWVNPEFDPEVVLKFEWLNNKLRYYLYWKSFEMVDFLTSFT